jgi:hypothetical protein
MNEQPDARANMLRHVRGLDYSTVAVVRFRPSLRAGPGAFSSISSGANPPVVGPLAR